MWKPATLCALALCCASVCAGDAEPRATTNKISFTLPDSFISAGKITLVYKMDNQTIEHPLAFEEINDSVSRRSKLKIGFVSYEPTVYYNREGNVLKINERGQCDSHPQDNLIPELDWFAKLIYTREELTKYLEMFKYQVGPSLLLKIPIATQNLNLNLDRTETYRNMECRVLAAKYQLDKLPVKLEVYAPPISLFYDTDTPFFTVRELASFEGEGGKGKIDVSMTIDYYNIERISGESMAELQKLEEEFSLPLGAGCSQHLYKLPNPDFESQSFIMSFRHASAQSFVTVAYDNEKGYLRRHVQPGNTVSIWDFNEDLMYSVDSHASVKSMIAAHDSNSIFDPALAKIGTQACAVLRVSDVSLSAAQRPKRKQSYSNELDLLHFLGAQSLAFIGRATVRNLPCSVYETIVDEPPPVFALSNESDQEGFHYIVQFFLMRTSTILENSNRIGNEFWPAKIVLLKRHKATGLVKNHYDMLEVSDFHWGLFGLDTKPSELFMAPECFDVDDEQVRIDLQLEFKRNGQNIPFGNDELSLLRQNRYLLEMKLLNDLFNTFKISRLHLTEFELTLRPHDALASLVISDRKYDSDLFFFGLGQLPEDKGAPNDRIVLSGGLEERTCVMLGSHITAVTLISYCPYAQYVRDESECTVVFNDLAPVIRYNNSKGPQIIDSSEDPFAKVSSACHIYSFSASAPPASGTQRWNEWRETLRGREFSFDIQNNQHGAKVTYTAKVRSFDIERKVAPVIVYNYRYVLDEVARVEAPSDALERQDRPPRVRSFEMTYSTVGDCARMCNLDVSCLSYSYCADPKVKISNGQVPFEPNEKCILSSLDIRRSDINKQLLYQKKNERGFVQVQDKTNQKSGDYELKPTNECSLHEKDFLDSFSETGEVLAIPMANVEKYSLQSSVTECAKFALDREGDHNQEQSHTIAYCPDSKACLLDSNLFASANGKMTNTVAIEEDQDEEDLINNVKTQESTCMIYRRKYQTFFHVSPRVLKLAKLGDDQSKATEEFSQLPLELSTVEECARACWNQFGHVCASFDYCSSESLCLINSIALDQPLDVNVDQQSAEALAKKRVQEKYDRLLEQRTGCLHYERDLRLDQLRRSHAKLRHKALDLSLISDNNRYQAYTGTFVTFLINVLFFCSVSAAFMVGLVLGKRVSGKLDDKYLAMPGSTGLANFINSLTGAARQDEQDDTTNLSLETHDNYANAIQLEEMNSRDAGADEVHNNGSAKGNDSAGNSGGNIFALM